MSIWLFVALLVLWIGFLMWLDRSPRSAFCRAIRDARSTQHKHRRQKDNECYQALTQPKRDGDHT